MKTDSYLQSAYTGDIYKVMDKYLLQLSPWKDGDDRRIYEYSNDDMHVITYQNAMMIVNKQFSEMDEEWEHDGRKFKARALVNKDPEEHGALLSMLPSHFVKDNTKILKRLPDDNEISYKDNNGNEFKMVKCQGKIYYILLIEKYYPKVPLHDMFFNFCKWVNIKNVKPIYDETNKRYI